jgi:ATP-dependent Clp protease ATP-binding subunit ClpA
MYISSEVTELIQEASSLAQNARFEYVTPELLLYVICRNPVFARAFRNCDGSVRQLDYQLKTWLEENMEQFDETSDEKNGPAFSHGMELLLSYACESTFNSEKSAVDLPHIIHAIYALPESYAAYYLQLQGVEQSALLRELTILYEEIAGTDTSDSRSATGKIPGRSGFNASGDASSSREAGEEDTHRDPLSFGELPEEEDNQDTQGAFWQQYAVCLNDTLEGVNPLIGRKEELERTMQILCRREKNNPLHLGEPGVGKTAVTYGLARLLEEDRVPAPLSGARIYSLDLGSLLAGTQYRGDFEKRFKKVMDSLSQEEKPIIYIDEIHNIVGAGAVNGGSFDISNMLKPYLAAGHMRFIGATTNEEYKKHFEKSKSLVRRFQNIEITEPDPEDAVKILEGLKENYENFHGITYEKGVLEYAVEMSSKYINERFLPDKAIDLIDEAGAYRRMHPLAQDPQTVDRELIDEILSKACHIPKQMVEKDETEALATLESRLLSRIFGQDEALSQVVNAVKFSRAGLLEEGKPLASLLFAGPTGVGKTEIARSLAEELGIRLIRFDMSEYEEKHAVAKLIGAPAGYVGYEEGGLLTEEVRKHPHAVLLLDEIEKAHPDIYNILLQVMDYATLTDNQGRKADFRNIILIMTSNAGASRIGKHGIGFQGQDVSPSVIMEEVKRIFQPEFRNRLNRIVVFHGMDEAMAEKIVEKKLGELQKMLSQKNIEFRADGSAKKLVREKGISVEFGAREIERVIQGEIKPLLVDEILFGALKGGGQCRLTVQDKAFRLQLLSDSAIPSR